MIYQTFISKELRLVKFLIEIWCVSEFLYSNLINLLNLWKAWWIFWNIPLHSFSEELALLTSAAIYNLIWGSFTFLASKVGRPPKIHQKRENLRCQSYSRLELCSTASIWSTSYQLISSLCHVAILIRGFQSSKMRSLASKITLMI